MPFPESVDTVTITCGPVLDADGNPRAGVRFYAIPAHHVFIAETMLRPGILVASTGADGIASLEVIATDSAGLCTINGTQITSFRYRIGLDDISTASSERQVYMPKAYATTTYEALSTKTVANTPAALVADFATKSDIENLVAAGLSADGVPANRIPLSDGADGWTWSAPPAVGGSVASVNGLTGTVVLDAAAVGADATGTAAGLVAALGTAAATDATDYATAAQGALADTAVQPADLGDSAGLDVGTTAGTVAAGDDARITGAVADLAAIAAAPKILGQSIHVGDTAPTDPEILVWIDTGTLVADTTPPTAPTLAIPTVTTATVTLVWSGSTDAVGVVGYNVYRNGTKLNTDLVTATTYTDTGLTSNTSYGPYTIIAYDAAGNSSDESNGRTTTTSASADTTPPTVPNGLVESSVTQTTFTLSWNASTDAVGVTGYEVFRGGVSLGTTTGTSFSVTGLTAGTQYAMTVRATDAAGNWSAQSASLNVTTSAATTLPGQVIGLSVTPGNQQASLTWTTPSAGSSAITDYSIQYKLTSSGTWLSWSHTASTSTAATITGLTNDSQYDFRVAAISAVGTGTYSSTSQATPVGVVEVFADTFDRANGSVGNGWTTVAGSWAISSNQLSVATTSTAAIIAQGTTVPGDANCYAQMTAVNHTSVSGATFSIMARIDPASVAYYYCFRRASSTAMKLYRFSSSTLTEIATGDYSLVNGDVMRIECNGSTISGYVNGSLICQATDATIAGSATTATGVRTHSNSNGLLLDDFSHGTL